MFTDLLKAAKEHLKAGDIVSASELLERARLRAVNKNERIQAHDFANEIQRAILNQYLGEVSNA